MAMPPPAQQHEQPYLQDQQQQQQQQYQQYQAPQQQQPTMTAPPTSSSPPLLQPQDFLPTSNMGQADNSGMPFQQNMPPPMGGHHHYQQTHIPSAMDGASGGVGDDSFAFRTPDSAFVRAVRYVNLRFQLLLDASTPHWAARWTFSLVILLIFMLRIVLAQGWYVICYGLSIYYLNLFIGFLSPKIDPAFQTTGDFDFDDPNDPSSGPMLPTRATDEFRPFIRRLPEFKFWFSATVATLISLFLTMFKVFDLPVFWPILLIYFILLFISTMRQQIRHMLKYGYVPWDKGKKKYGGQGGEDTSKLFSTNY